MASQFQMLVDRELESARKVHGPIRGHHDAYGRLLEEVDEFWDEVKLKGHLRNRNKTLNELVQVAAMAQRAAEDLKLL
jgi:hypothetical protein